MKSKQLIIGLVALAVIAVGGFMLMNKDDKPKNTAQNNSQNTSSSNDNNKSADNSSSKLSLKAQTIGQQPDCSIYNFEELGKIWGVTFTDTDIDSSKVSELTGPGTKLYECDYNETDSGKGVSYVIQYKEYADEGAAKQSMNNTRDGAKYGDKVYFTLEEKSGVGDEAFFSKSTGTGVLANNQQMYIRKSNVVFLLSGVNLDGVNDSYKDKLVASFKLHFN